MRQTLSSKERTPEHRVSGIEQLRHHVFGEEYRPDATIDFSLIKKFLLKKEKEYVYRKMRDYNYKLMDPKKLCDMFIQNPPKQRSISFLESLPEDTKRCLADLFLELISFDFLQQKFGTAMLFWVRNHSYHYSKRCEDDLKKFLITATTFVGSERNYDLLQKAHMAQWQLHKNSASIDTILLLFEMAKYLPQNIVSEPIQAYFTQTLGKDFSLGALYSRGESTKGKEQERYQKDIDSTGNVIDSKIFWDTSTYQDFLINDKKKNLEIINRDSQHIHKDRSGESYRIFLDGPLAIGLFHEGKPIAVLSFSLLDAHTFFIHQMQTVAPDRFDRYGRTIGQNVDSIVHTLPWQKILYDVAVLLAKKYHCKKIVIQSGENNRWIHEKRKELRYDEYHGRIKEEYLDQTHLSIGVAKQIYDTFAIKQHFKQNKKSKDWSKKITT